jgi:hypothetical protein
MQAVNRLPALEYKLEAEPNQTYSRVYFSSGLSYLNGSLRLNTNYKKICTKIDAYIKKDNYDYIRPIKFAVNYWLASNEDSNLFGGFSYDLGYIRNFPIIHQDSNKTEFEVLKKLTLISINKIYSLMFYIIKGQFQEGLWSR